MRKLLHAILVGVLGAAAVHIVILLMLPDFTERDAWSRLSLHAGLYRTVRMDAEADPVGLSASVDPLFFALACRFDLSEAMVRMNGSGRVPYWSVSFYDRAGQNINSFNDRISEDGDLDFVVLNATHMIEIRKEMPPGLERAAFVEAAIDEGIIVLRSFVPDSSWRPVAAQFLEGVRCEPA